MKLNFILVILFISQVSQAQNASQNKISVVGHAKQDFIHDHLSATISFAAIPRNDYQKIYSKSINEIKKEFQKHLSSFGYDTLNLVEIFPQTAYYNSNYPRQYELVINSREDALKLISGKIPGVSISSFKYRYKPDLELDINKLTIDAINNAEEKALFVAKQLNKKLGEIISVNYRTYHEKSLPPKHHNLETFTYNQQITIIYELTD